MNADQRQPMKIRYPEQPDGFKGGVEAWLRMSHDTFESLVYQVRQTGDREGFDAVVADFRRRVLLASERGYEFFRAWGDLAEHIEEPWFRLHCFRRAYDLLLGDPEEWGYTDMPCSLQQYYTLAKFADHIARIHEADGDFPKAAEWYRLSQRHLSDGADAADAELNDEARGTPRRLRVEESLQRVSGLMGRNGG